MARIEFPNGLEGTENLPRTRRALQNCFNNGNGSVIGRPGIVELNTTSRIARGSFVWDGSLYNVASQDLIKITNKATGAFIVIGTIDGIDNIEFSIGFNFAVIIVKNATGKGYTLSKSTDFTNITSVEDNGSGVAQFNHAGTTPAVGNSVTIKGFINPANSAYNTTGVVTASTATSFEISSIAFVASETVGEFTIVLAEITDPQFKSSIDVANINGRTVYIPFNGDPAFFSDVGAPGSIQPLSFFDAEELPDENNGVFNFKNTLFITGTDSIELFRDTGASPNPFARINGSRILNGLIGGLLEYNNTFLFIGREKDQDFGIYSIAQGVAPKISNEFIDLILSTYTQDELKRAIPGRIKWRGYDIATFTLIRDSFAFFGGNWFKLDTVFDGNSRPWGAGFITQFEGEYFTAFNNKIGKFVKGNSDYGNRITRIIDTALSQADTDFFACQSIELGISQGFNAIKGSVALFMSNNNVIYGPPVYRDLGQPADYDKKLIWNFSGGLGTYRGFMGIRFFTTEDIDFTDDYIVAKIR